MKIKTNRIEIKNARTIGILFLLAFLAYGFGRYCLASAFVFNTYIGAILVLVNSAMVLFIGILFKKTLRKYSALIGNIYLFARIFEAVSLASVVVTLIPGISFSNDYDYFLAMLVLGIGSVPMCLTLYKHSITPPWLAIWGAIGYAIFYKHTISDNFGKTKSNIINSGFGLQIHLGKKKTNPLVS